MIGEIDADGWRKASEYHLTNGDFSICRYATKDAGKRFGLFRGSKAVKFSNKASELKDLAEEMRWQVGD